MSKVVSRFCDEQAGATSVGILLAVAFTLVVSIAVVNLFLYLYGHGAARAAIDEGVRAGSRVDAGPVACERRAAEALIGLMPGRLSDGVVLSCEIDGEELVAVADVTLDSPMPGIPSWSFHMEARAVQEMGE